MEPFEIDGEIVLRERTYAKWDVVLDCGHRDTKLTDLDWAPDRGLTHRRAKRRLATVIKELCTDADDEQYWRRVYAEKHPEPAPFVQCHTCGTTRTVATYQRIGWVKPQTAPTPATEAAIATQPATPAEEAGI